MRYYQIYLTENKINGKTYIGQHFVDSRKQDDYIGSGLLLHKAIKKYGIEKFEKHIMEVCETREQADFIEKKYIAFHRLCGLAQYNLADGGQGGNLSRFVDSKKISAKLKGRKITWADKISKSHTGLKATEESKRKMSMARKGKKRPEHSKRMKGENNPMFDKKRSQEVKDAISLKNKGKKRTEETKLKMKENKKLRKWFNNGIINRFTYNCPEGFKSGRVK